MIRTRKIGTLTASAALVAAVIALAPNSASAMCGTASWYNFGKVTANGERFRPSGMTAAHRSLPFGTRVEVKDMRTGRAITVRINDRGPFIGGRIIDLAQGAAKRLGFEHRGVTRVCIRPLGRSRKK